MKLSPLRTASAAVGVRRWLVWVVALTAPLQAAVGVVVLVVRRAPVARPAAFGAVDADRLPGPGSLTVPRSTGHPSVPLTLDIPSIGVTTSLVRLGLGADGRLDVPGDFGVAGWWTGGTAPGDAGAAVVVGHVDSYRAAAVFYRVRELKQGDPIVVHRSDGTSVMFEVDALHQYPKDQLPTDAIYGPTSEPTLRLITCGGSFDRARGTYRDNVVAFARLAPPASAATQEPAAA